MHQPRQLRFGPFCLDLNTDYLRRGEVEVSLRPRTFAVLRYLAEHPNQLVTADTLYRQIWQRDYVSRSVLRVSIREIRAALDDSAQAPRYLETVRGQGYRFIGSLEPKLSSSRPMVGRQQELRQLGQWFEQAIAGQRQLVLVSGEAGMGKTTLIDKFLEPYLGDNELRFGHGQCIKHTGEDEAYMPILEAIGRLGRRPGGDGVRAVLRQVAPSWLVHLPALIPEEERQQLQKQETTPQQMLRELSEALEALSAETPFPPGSRSPPRHPLSSDGGRADPQPQFLRGDDYPLHQGSGPAAGLTADL